MVALLVALGGCSDDLPDVESDAAVADASDDTDLTLDMASPDSADTAAAHDPDMALADEPPDTASADVDMDTADGVPDALGDAHSDVSSDPDEGQDESEDAALDPSEADAARDSATDLPPDSPLDLSSDSSPDLPGDPLEVCRERLVQALEWPVAHPEQDLLGSVELGQTHVIGSDDQRLAPPVVAERATALLFTPDVGLPADTALSVAAFDDGTLLGVLPMAPPGELRSPLEQDITPVELAPYSTSAWSALLPWPWLARGVELEIGHVDDSGVLRRHLHRFEDLAAPHRFTVTRTKIVLFGEPEFTTDTLPATRVARDFFPALPFAELRFVDSLPWRLNEIVVSGSSGPVLVQSEQERLDATDGEDHWTILKHQVALRMSLANTGRGLAATGGSDGDSSPYSFGTSVAMGWFRRPDGSYADIDDAPWAAGWTGWTAMWANECGNGFIHEVGHSLTLAHFTGGAAASWGIADEYPQDGVNLASHPWGYDTVRDRFRTWYRVNAGGPVDDAGLVGKRDPMNGGEAANGATCFPQYTAYHARKAQAWAQRSPTIRSDAARAGVFLWDHEAGHYEPSVPDPSHELPIAVDVPVATLIGTLGQGDGVSRIYPPVFTASGNAFELPAPVGSDLPGAYAGARWFLEIEYADESVDHALIARGAIDDTGLYLFSVNLALDDLPVAARLYRGAAGYPDLVVDTATLVHSVDIVPPPIAFDPVVRVGHGALGNAELTLTERCQPTINCADRRVESRWRVADGQLHFEPPVAAAPAAVCGDSDAYTVLEIPVRREDGATATLIAHAQRVVNSGGQYVATRLNDNTPWFDRPDLSQALAVWLPWEANSSLVTGRYTNDGPFIVTGLLDGEPSSQTPILIDLELIGLTLADLSAGEYAGPPLTSPDSSMYFLVRDAAVGPASRVWWDDGVEGPTRLTVPVIDAHDGQPVSLYVSAQQREGAGARFDLNAGRGAGNNEHRVVLWVDPAQNTHLVAGHTYQSPSSAPLVIEGRRWHAPNAERLEGVFAFDIDYTP